MVEHTATPWIVRILGDDCFVEGNEIAGRTVAGEYKREILSDEDYPKKKADAAFITKACNNFEEMLRTLKKTKEWAEYYIADDEKNVFCFNRIIDELSALIAKVDGND